MIIFSFPFVILINFQWTHVTRDENYIIRICVNHARFIIFLLTV